MEKLRPLLTRLENLLNPVFRRGLKAARRSSHMVVEINPAGPDRQIFEFTQKEEPDLDKRYRGAIERMPVGATSRITLYTDTGEEIFDEIATKRAK